MPAYVIFLREKPIHNQAEMDIYTKGSRERPRDPKLKPLAVYGALEALEGTLPDGVVILEFPTVEDAKTWYYSPEYQAAAKHRQNAAEYRGIIVQGL
jgi:uncharacterized protein (DUF1330 family)